MSRKEWIAGRLPAHEGSTEIRDRSGTLCVGGAQLADTSLVSQTAVPPGRPAQDSADMSQDPSTSDNTGATPSTSTTGALGLSLIRRYYGGTSISTTAQELMLASWSGGTQRQYNTYINKWKEYCSLRGHNPIAPAVEDVVNFLASLQAFVGFCDNSTGAYRLTSYGEETA